MATILSWIATLLLCIIPLHSALDMQMNQFIIEAQPIIYEELGTVLLPSEIIASSSSNIYQSIFLKIGIPQPPKRTCVLICLPKMETIATIVADKDGCEIQKLQLPQLSYIRDINKVTKQDCYAECLKQENCGIISYDENKRICTLRTDRFWRVNAINESLTTSSTLLSCTLANHQTSRDICAKMTIRCLQY